MAASAMSAIPSTSEEDEDPDRLMIDTSGEDDDNLRSKPYPKCSLYDLFPEGVPPGILAGTPVGVLPAQLTFPTELSPERIKALAKVKPTLDKVLESVEFPPEVDKIMKDAQEVFKKNNQEENMKAVNKFRKAMFDVKLTPDVEKALDETLRNEMRDAKVPVLFDPSFELIKGCEKTTAESADVDDHPLVKLKGLVEKPFDTQSNQSNILPTISTASTSGTKGSYFQPAVRYLDTQSNQPNIMPTISTASTSGTKGCETVVANTEVSSKSKPSVPAPSNAKSNAKPRPSGRRKRINPARDEFLRDWGQEDVLPCGTNVKKIESVVNHLENVALEQQHLDEFVHLSQSTSGKEEFAKFQEYIKSVRTSPLILEGTDEVTRTVRNLVSSRSSLTIIPKSMAPHPVRDDDHQAKIHVPKSSCRRSPPPMIPISLQSFNTEETVRRLKKLGTDIELESTRTMIEKPTWEGFRWPVRSPTPIEFSGMPSMPPTPIEFSGMPSMPPTPIDFKLAHKAYFMGQVDGHNEDNDDDDDDDVPLMPSVDCILSTEPIVTIDEISEAYTLPSRYLDAQSSSTPFKPPPPSLIPIHPYPMGKSYPSTSQAYVRRPSNNISAKPKRKHKTSSAKSELAKLAHALVQPAGAVKSNDTLLQVPQTLYRNPSSFAYPDETVTMRREVEIFKIQDKPHPKNIKKQDNASPCSIETIVRRLKEKPIENKTVSESAVSEADEAAAALPLEITLVVQAPSESQKDLEAVINNNNVRLTENKLDEPSDRGAKSESPEASYNKPAPIGNVKTTAEKRAETDLRKLPTTALSENTASPPPPSPLFVFDCDSAVITNAFQNQRKLYTCSICSAVYCKMFSVKKHYFRNHVNPCMVSEEDARKCGLETSAKTSPANEGFYRCNECMQVFVEMLDLKKHLLVHPVDKNESFKRRRKSKASYPCEHCGETFSKKKLYHQHVSNCSRVNTPPAPEPKVVSVVPLEPAVDAPPPVQESNDATPSSDHDNVIESDEGKKDALGISQMCLFCDVTFTSTAARTSHVMQQHHPKRKHHPCSYCKNKKFVDLKDLLKHICGAHNKRYFGCALCKIRFKTKGDLTAHNAESHPTQERAPSPKTAAAIERAKPPSTVITKSGKIHKCQKCLKIFPTDKELKRHRKKGHNVGKPVRTVKPNNCGAFFTDAYELKYRTSTLTTTDYETEFYKNVEKNVRFNMEHCLDGKILDTVALSNPKTTTRRTLSHLKTRSSTSKHLLREGYTGNRLSFQDMYGTENMNGQFISNVSRLHLATQLEVIERTKEKKPKVESASTADPSGNMAKELALTENENVGGGPVPHEETENDNNKAIFSGEWTRPKKYICSTCFAEFINLLDWEDHRWREHPNVCSFSYEFPADQTPNIDWATERYLGSTGLLTKTDKKNLPKIKIPDTCRKCEGKFTPLPELHKHQLKCGGDENWMQTVFASSKKHKKHRSYCGRRRKNTARVRGLKRNIPTTPVKNMGMSKNRQKAGDTESIQKMIANLPAKRITRRIVQFDDIEPKSHSRNNGNNNALGENNILTRKRRVNSAQGTGSISVKVSDLKKKNRKKKTTGSLSKKSNRSSAPKVAILSTTEPIEQQDPTLNTPPLVPEPTDVQVKEEIVSAASDDASPKEPEEIKEEIETVAPPSDVQNVGSSTVVVKQEEEIPEIDLEKIEPAADSDSCLPDSSVIIAAMRETMRQTDAVIPSQTFTVSSKKRKREDLKCKPDAPESSSESSSDPPPKRVCTECKNPLGDLCECNPKSGNTRSASLRPRDQNSRLRELRNARKPPPAQPKSPSENAVERGDADSENSKTPSNVKQRKSTTATEKDDSALKNEVTAVNSKSRKSVTKDATTSSIAEVFGTDETTSAAEPKSSKKAGGGKNSRRSKTRSTGKGKVGKSTVNNEAAVPKLNDNVDEDTKPVEIEADKSDGNEASSSLSSSSASSNVGEVTKKAKSAKSVVETNKTTNAKTTTEPNKNVKEPPTVDGRDGLESNNIGICKVCQSPSIREPCLECLAAARKYKVCVYCKQEVTPKPYSLQICVACKDESAAAKREIVEWIRCRVCHSKNHRDVCNKCVFMAHKFQICALCNVPGDYTQKTGRPVCEDCEEKWFPPTTTNREDGGTPLPPPPPPPQCSECSTLRANDPSSQKLCNKCNATGGSVVEAGDESTKTCDTNDVGASAGGDESTSMDVGTNSSTASVNETPSAAANSAIISSLVVTNPPILAIVAPTPSAITPVPSTPAIITAAVPSTNIAISTLPILTPNPILMSNISTPAVARNIPEDVPAATNSPSKKNVNIFLECKGCHGVYDRVSAYKLHCDTCSARHACMEEKKPLLGFVNSNTNLVSSDANTAGPSFEILETVKMKSSFPANEGGKNAGEAHSMNDVNVPGSVYDSDSSTSSKRLELGKGMKTRRSLATDESMSETIESVIQTMCYPSKSEDDSLLNSATPRASSRKQSGDAAADTSGAAANQENLEKVKNHLETLLETPTAENDSSTEILLPDEEPTVAVEPVNNASKNKKKVVVKKKKVSRRGPTTRSSLAKSGAVEEASSRTAKKGEVESGSASSAGDGESSGTLTTRLRRKPSDIPSLAEEEVDDAADTSTTVMKLRRKPPPVEVTIRTLRSRSKPETRDRTDEAEKAEEDSMEEAAAPNAVATSRRSKGLKRKSDLVDQKAEDESKPLSVEGGEDRANKMPNKKLKSESTTGPGLTAAAAVKTTKPARKSVKRNSPESSSSLPKNELPESDRKARKLTCESDKIAAASNAPRCNSLHEPMAVAETSSNNLNVFESCSSNITPMDTTSSSSNVFEFGGNVVALEDGTSNAVVDECPLSAQNQCTFPNPTASSSSTAVSAYDESIMPNRFSFDESMYTDGYETGGAPSFEENQQDGAEASTWSPFLELTSLGSILDSVNELLSRPEVVSFCVADPISNSTESVKDAHDDGLTLMNVNDGAKAKEDHSFEQGDESPTLMDLDHQTAHHSEKGETAVSLEEEPSVAGSSSSSTSSTDSKEEICEVCRQSYPDLKSLKLHMSAVHYPTPSTSRSAPNGKLRSSPRTNQNGSKIKQKCSQCQKVLVGKREMASHVDEHVTTFATNQGCDAVALRKGIASKLEVLFYNNAFGNYMKSPKESSGRSSTALRKTLSSIKKNQFGAWKSAVNRRLRSDSSAATTSAAASKDVAGCSTAVSCAGASAAGATSTNASTRQTRRTSTTSASLLNFEIPSNNATEEDCYPCPICTQSFKLTCTRNQHLIFMHAPRTSTHPPAKNECSSNSLTKDPKNGGGPSESLSVKPADGNVIRSYLLNESVNSCLEAKKEAVHKAIAESTAKNMIELRKQIGRSTDALPGSSSSSSSSSSSAVADLQTIEGPPALEPAASGEQILNNTDRSPPKLEASTGALNIPSTSSSAPSILRQNLTSSSVASSSSSVASTSGNPTPVSQRNGGKPGRKKMSKKEMDLPPAVVKFKAEQALLELSINKFRKIRSTPDKPAPEKPGDKP